MIIIIHETNFGLPRKREALRPLGHMPWGIRRTVVARLEIALVETVLLPSMLRKRMATFELLDRWAGSCA